MRYVNGVLCVCLALFAIAQYNDPDFLVWFVIYGVTAAWCGLAAFRPGSVAHSQPIFGAFGVCLALAAIGAIWLWPSEFATWWDDEVVREGMGLMIVTVSLAAAAVVFWQTRRIGAPHPA